MRRKGEQPRVKRLERWDERGYIAQSIASGAHWLDAWLMQNNTPYHRLSSLTGIPVQRFAAITSGDVVSRAEIDAFARAWCMSAEDLIASIDGKTFVIE